MLFLLTLCTALWPVAASAAKPPRRLDIALNSATVEVQRATPGGAVLLVGYESRSRGGSPVFRRVEREVKADADGAARIGLPAPAAQHSFWVVFDLTTGSYGAVTAAGRPLRELELGERYLKREANGQLDRLTGRFDYVYTVAIRPGAGVWTATTGDGGAGDGDGALNGSMTVTARQLRPFGATRGELAEFRDGDVVAVFVPHQMGYLLTAVKK